ncbi:MAG: hypothetical protein R3E04_06300 [Sphingobium sp.]
MNAHANRNEIAGDNASPVPVSSCGDNATVIRAGALGRGSAGALAAGAVAIGALAVGIVAIGRLSVGKLALRKGLIRKLRIDWLEVGEIIGPDDSAKL